MSTSRLTASRLCSLEAPQHGFALRERRGAPGALETPRDPISVSVESRSISRRSFGRFAIRARAGGNVEPCILRDAAITEGVGSGANVRILKTLDTIANVLMVPR
jgi:hypothetical protein